MSSDTGNCENNNSTSTIIQTWTDLLISEMSKVPVLWDKYKGTRRKRMREWEALAAKLNKGPKEVKSKWRNVKDTFRKEAKKVELPPEGPGDKPITEYYTGQWQYFEKLMFLWDNDMISQDNDEEEVYIEAPAKPQTTKQENNDTESDNNSDDHTLLRVKCQGSLGVKCQDNAACSQVDPIGISCEDRKRRSGIDTDPDYESKRRCVMNCGVIENNEMNEDWHFAKSLVPFMRKLNPIRKLIIRNEMHSLLLNELLCDRCKAVGPQRNCTCNF